MSCLIEGKIPDSIGDVHSLAVLNLSFNQLTGWFRLQGVVLQRMCTSESILLHFLLARCFARAGNIPTAFEGLYNIGEVKLNDNKLTGSWQVLVATDRDTW